jgi:LCP family protein required for cell wall assembly
LNQAVPQRAPRGTSTTNRSGSVAAVLSFIFPGLGQAYLRLRREALIFGVPVAVLFVALGLWIGTSGLAKAGARLLDPSFALLLAGLALVLGLWWVASIVHAWRAGRPTSTRVPRRTTGSALTAAILLPIALVGVVAATSLYGASWAYRISVADKGFTDSVDCTIEACNFGTPQPTATNPVVGQAPSPTAQPSLAPGQSPTPEPTEGDYNQPSEPPPSLSAGPTPGFDITTLDAHDDGWLNVLLIGLDTRCDGGIVTGANTDTMIVASVDTSNNHVYMFSFPRDTAQFPLYDSAGGTFNGKLNQFAGWTKGQVNTDGTPRFPEPGQQSLAYEIGFLLGIPIDYFASINICGFPQLIDAVGGVDVCNTKTIDDASYPNPGGQPGFHLDPGEYHMDGATALAYARSRHGSSDFARAKRQQQLLSSIRQAILQPQNIQQLPDIISAMADVVHTNFPPDLISDPNNGLLALASRVDGTPTAQYVFDPDDWAIHLNRNQTNGRSVQFLKLDVIAALSYQIFGDTSLYVKNGPVPTAEVPQPAPSESPSPGDTPVC